MSGIQTDHPTLKTTMPPLTAPSLVYVRHMQS